MRGFRDHRKLTMVGFRLNRSHCLFDGYGIRSQVPEGVSRELDPKVFGVTFSLWSGDTVSACECWGKTQIQTSLGSDLETGRCQNSRGELFQKRDKGF